MHVTTSGSAQRVSGGGWVRKWLVLLGHRWRVWGWRSTFNEHLMSIQRVCASRSVSALRRIVHCTFRFFALDAFARSSHAVQRFHPPRPGDSEHLVCNLPPPPPPLKSPPQGGICHLGPESMGNTGRQRRHRKFLRGAEADLQCDTMVQISGAAPPPPGGNRHFVAAPPPPP